MKITFTYFYTQYYYDYVIVYDGSNASSTILATLSGYNYYSSYRSTQEHMFVRFTSDSSETGDGFSATYVSEGIPRMLCGVTFSCS